jgi:hypothetical protein
MTTREEAKELAKVLEGWARREEVQRRPKSGHDIMWSDVSPNIERLLVDTYEYRLKPKPRKLWAVIHPDQELYAVKSNQNDAIAWVENHAQREKLSIVSFTEDLEDGE